MDDKNHERAGDPELLARLKSYIASMAPHQKDRVAGQLLIRAAREIERLSKES